MDNHHDYDYDLMPGLYDENSDFYGSFTSNINDPATCSFQGFSSGTLENDSYTATPPSAPYKDNVQNDMAWNHGCHLLPLSKDEIEAIQRSRAAQQRSFASSLSFTPTPYQDANFVFSTPELDFAGPSLSNSGTSGPVTSLNGMGVSNEVEVMEPSGAMWALLRDAPKTGTNQSFTAPKCAPRLQVQLMRNDNQVFGPPTQVNQHTPSDQHDRHPSPEQHDLRSGKCPRPGCRSAASFTNAALKRHLRDVHDDPLVCTIRNCSHKKPFSRRSDLNRHKRSVHSQDREYVCTNPTCGVQFARKDHLSKHMRDKHPTYLCPVNHCCRGSRDRFANSEDLARHLDSEHGDFECAVKACAKAPMSKFTKASLRQHIRSHHGVKDGFQAHAFRSLEADERKTLTEADFNLAAYDLTECKVCGEAYKTLS